MKDIINYRNCRNCTFARFSSEVESLTTGTNVLSIKCTNDNFIGNLNEYGKPVKDYILFDVNRTTVWIDGGYDITDCKGFIDIEEMYRGDAFEKLNSDIAYIYYKVKQNTKIPIYRFEYMYKDFEDKANVGNIDIIFSEGDESNIKKMEDVKKKYGDFFLYFNEIAIF